MFRQSAGACPIEEDPQPKRFGPFGRNQASLAADVVATLEMPDLGLVPVGIALQTGKAFLEGAAETGTDLKAFFAVCIGLEIVHHGAHLAP